MDIETDRDAYSPREFARRHGFSLAKLYELWAVGEGPKFFRVGTRRLVSREAAAEWRKSLEMAA